MGLGRLLVRPAAAPAGENRSIGFGFGRGVVPDGPVGYGFYRGALSIPGAWRAATLLADLLGSLPWHAYRERGGRPVELLDPTPPLLGQPNPPDTRMATVAAWGLDYLMHGNAIGVFAAWNAEGWPTAAVPVPAEQVSVRRVGPGAESSLPVGSIEYQIGNLRFSAAEVLHVKGPCAPGELRGRGVLEVHLDTLDLAREQARQARSLSRHGVPTGTLKSDNADLTEDEARELKAAWLRSQEQRTIAVLNASTTFVPLSWNPEELQLVEARKFSLHELALIFGVPLSFLGVETSNRTYRNAETEGLDLLKFSLGGHLARFEQAWSQAFPRGTWVKANTDAVLRADTITRYQAHAIALDKRFLTPDEVRELEDRPPLTPAQREALQPAPRPAAPAPDDEDAGDQEEAA